MVRLVIAVVIVAVVFYVARRLLKRWSISRKEGELEEVQVEGTALSIDRKIVTKRDANERLRATLALQSGSPEKDQDCCQPPQPKKEEQA